MMIRVSEVPPHGSRLFSIRKNLDRPQLISTNLHLLQGAVDIEKVEYNVSGKILLVSAKHFVQENGKLFLYHPNNYQLEKMTTNKEEIF